MNKAHPKKHEFQEQWKLMCQGLPWGISSSEQLLGEVRSKQNEWRKGKCAYLPGKWLPHHGLHFLEMQNLQLGSFSSQPIAEIKIKTEDKGQVTAIFSRVSNV